MLARYVAPPGVPPQIGGMLLRSLAPGPPTALRKTSPAYAAHTHTHVHYTGAVKAFAPREYPWVPSLTAPVPCVWGVCAGFVRSVSCFAALRREVFSWCFGCLWFSVSSCGCSVARAGGRARAFVSGGFVVASVCLRLSLVGGRRFVGCSGSAGLGGWLAFVGGVVGGRRSVLGVRGACPAVGSLRFAFGWSLAVGVGRSLGGRPSVIVSNAHPQRQKQHTKGNAYSAVRFFEFR